MVTILHKTKGNVSPFGKPRVFFTCHPEDFAEHFETVCADIFKTHDCAVYYTADMSEPILEEDLPTGLESANLFVVPVTLKLLTERNRAMDHDIPFALRKHIPVLPIMMESDIDAIYSRPNRFGELQYLCPIGGDSTEISYKEKLKKYLDSVLVSNELAGRVREAFHAYIFLSYRKKDRRYANELMRLIHRNPEYRDVAIWYDEFLTPGESFRENIEKMVDDCTLFTLLVTPRLLEKVTDEAGQLRDNYVISTELPLAREKQKKTGEDIMAVEMEQTDRTELESICVAVNVPYGSGHFFEDLSAALKKLAKTENDTDPTHSFLIGIAYLEGIDVETDRQRGLALLTAAAEAGLPEAMEKLYRMHSEGVGVPVNYREAAKWAQLLMDHYQKLHGEAHPVTLTWIHNLALMYNKSGQYKDAYRMDERSYQLHCQVFGKHHPDTAAALHNFALTCSDMGYPEKALELSKEAHDLYRERMGEAHPRTLSALNNLAHAYSESGNAKQAWELFGQVYELRREGLGEEDPDTLVALNNYALACGDLGDPETERDLLEKAYAAQCKVLGDEHPSALNTLSNLAYVYEKLGQTEKALELYEKAYAGQCKILGKAHPKTLGTLNNMAKAYGKVAEVEKSLAASETVYTLLRQTLGETHPKTLIALVNLGYGHHNYGSLERAAQYLELAYELACQLYGPKDSRAEKLLDNLAMTYWQIGTEESKKKAIELFTKEV